MYNIPEISHKSVSKAHLGNTTIKSLTQLRRRLPELRPRILKNLQIPRLKALVRVQSRLYTTALLSVCARTLLFILTTPIQAPSVKPRLRIPNEKPRLRVLEAALGPHLNRARRPRLVAFLVFRLADNNVVVLLVVRYVSVSLFSSPVLCPLLLGSTPRS